MITVALADDHKIFCESLVSLINDLDDFEVIWTVHDGDEAIEKLSDDAHLPHILLLDINMPGSNGLEVARWLDENKKPVSVLVLTMEEDDTSIISMLQYGVKGYLLKSVSADELFHALHSVVKYGFYYTPEVTRQIGRQVGMKAKDQVPELKEREKELLQYLCSDMSYSEIAKKMFLSESTVDTYRARLFEKFEVRNRVGLLLKANRLGVIKL
ncbi:MAG TPA: response regulator transcription factor [Chitinophagaceae bacterium]|nr:response regulator transcription factor [Chitinophagaceae bacterium]